MIVLSGADLVLPDRIVSPGTLVIDSGRIVEIRPDAAGGRGGDGHVHFAFHRHYIVPGFIDVHVHGVEGVDVLDDGDAVAGIAGRLPRFGVTAFCPTTMACPPDRLRRVLEQVRDVRKTPPVHAARVLPAHLESNFINAVYRGAQPASCLRAPRDAFGPEAGPHQDGHAGEPIFSAADILAEIDRGAPDVGIVTIAPELEAANELILWLTARGHRVSMGHSAATFEEAQAAIAVGARHATHLFNRMPPFAHRAPGLVGAVLQTDDVIAELICDGYHVHPAVLRTVIAAKRPTGVFAITDGTAAAGLPLGSRAALGGQPIVRRHRAAFLDDGTIAGSVATMDRVFQLLTGRVGLALGDAVTVCSTTPARELGLVGHGVLAVDAVADLVVLDQQFSVVQTYVGGELVYARQET